MAGAQSRRSQTMATSFADIVIVGSGAGGGATAWALRDVGARVLLLERGDYLPREPQNYSAHAVFLEHRYKTRERWQDASGKTFAPGVHYVVGGNTKMYGAALPRFRERDFGEVQHEGGDSPAWPFSYAELEPWYTRAEALMMVHGEAGADPTDPPRSGPFPFPPMHSDPYMQHLAERLSAQGLHPAPMPIGVDFGRGGRCIRCQTCDAFPCQYDAKADAETCFVRPALAGGQVTLQTRTLVRRLLLDDSGQRVIGVEAVHDGETETIFADIVVVACGAVNSAALLLRSANGRWPRGVANSSDQVGRNYMVHNNSVLIAVDPARLNPTVFQKTMSVNDFYEPGFDPSFPYPMGNLQPTGKVQAPMLAGALPRALERLLGAIAARSVDWWVMSEDLPDPENRVTLVPDGSIRIAWKPNNLVAHANLMHHAKMMLRRAGYAVTVDRRMGIETNSHQCGTVRMGRNPATSVVDPWCRSHDIDNLYVVDGSIFPSSSAVNPALTIVAQALRAGERIAHLYSGASSLEPVDSMP